MAETADELIPYCGPNDAPDVPYWMQRLAERVAALIKPLRATVEANTLGAGGLVYETKGVSASGAFTALTVVSNIPTFTFLAGRRYEIVWDGSHTSSVGTDTIDMQIATCSTTDSAAITTGLTVLRQKTFPCQGQQPNLTRASVMYATDTTRQIKFLGQRGTGSGSMTCIASANVHTLYQIFDMGEQL